MKDNYTIASVANADINVALTALAHNVNALLLEGYAPVGSVSVTICALGQVERVITGNPNMPVFLLTQALVLSDYAENIHAQKMAEHTTLLFSNKES